MKRLFVDEIELTKERHFEKVHEQEETGSDTEKRHLRHLVDEAIDRVDGARRVRKHGGNANEQTTDPTENSGVGKVLEELLFEFSQKLEHKHEENDASDDSARSQVVERIE